MAPLVRTGGSRHTGLAAPPHRNIHLLGGTIKEMMEAEMDDHLGYEKSERSDNDDYRNGYKHKQVNSRYGSSPVGYLEGIFVLEEYKKRGYAKELLGECQN